LDSKYLYVVYQHEVDMHVLSWIIVSP
jgi:hypothetical protein